MGSQNVQKSTSRPSLGVISISNRIKKSRPTHWKAQNSPKTSKLDRNRPENFPGSAAEAKPIEFKMPFKSQQKTYPLQKSIVILEILRGLLRINSDQRQRRSHFSPIRLASLRAPKGVPSRLEVRSAQHQTSNRDSLEPRRSHFLPCPRAAALVF